MRDVWNFPDRFGEFAPLLFGELAFGFLFDGDTGHDEPLFVTATEGEERAVRLVPSIETTRNSNSLSMRSSASVAPSEARMISSATALSSLIRLGRKAN